MTSLRDPFDTVHKKDIKNKRGEVVAQVDYVGWSQAADRLDAVIEGGWSFSIMAIGDDWVHGRLTIGDRYFENIGYAENAEAEWKKEVLKDAASDAFKRCAALAGVARYLYDKDSHSISGGREASSARPAAPIAPTNGHRAGAPPSPGPAARASEPPPLFDDGEEFQPIGTPVDICPIHNVEWRGETGDLWHKDGDGKYCRHPANVKRPAAARR
jgi:hypothetical protein